MLLSGTDGQNYTSSIVDRLFYFNLSHFSHHACSHVLSLLFVINERFPFLKPELPGSKMGTFS